MKESYYFPHDYDPTGDPKIQALIGEYGAVGYGIFWRIVEMLHSDTDHKLPLKQYIFIAIAKQMLTSAEQTEAIIKYCINVSELFSTDELYFWSNRVNSNFDKRAEISIKRSIAGKAGAIAKQNLANASKGKKRKEEESINTWKTDFEIYKNDLRTVFEKLIEDKEFIKQQEKYYPGLDIKLSIEKACVNFWATEAGWKKKKQSRSKDIDWKATLTNAIGLNKVYKPK